MTPKQTPTQRTPRTLTQLSNTWKLTALGYDLWRVRSLSLLTGRPFPLERELALMLEWTVPIQDERWLDVGTSTGNYARALSSRGAKVVGLDFSAPMLEVARSKPSPGVTYRQDYLENLSLESVEGALDGIAVGATLNEFYDTNSALERMAGLLKPQGRLFMMYLTRSESRWGRLLQTLLAAGGVRFPARVAVKHTLEQAGMHYARGERWGVVVLELYYKM